MRTIYAVEGSLPRVCCLSVEGNSHETAESQPQKLALSEVEGRRKNAAHRKLWVFAKRIKKPQRDKGNTAS